METLKNSDRRQDFKVLLGAIMFSETGWMDECCLTTHRHNLGHSVSENVFSETGLIFQNCNE